MSIARVRAVILVVVSVWFLPLLLERTMAPADLGWLGPGVFTFPPRHAGV